MLDSPTSPINFPKLRFIMTKFKPTSITLLTANEMAYNSITFSKDHPAKIPIANAIATNIIFEIVTSRFNFCFLILTLQYAVHIEQKYKTYG